MWSTVSPDETPARPEAVTFERNVTPSFPCAVGWMDAVGGRTRGSPESCLFAGADRGLENGSFGVLVAQLRLHPRRD